MSLDEESQKIEAQKRNMGLNKVSHRMINYILAFVVLGLGLASLITLYVSKNQVQPSVAMQSEKTMMPVAEGVQPPPAVAEAVAPQSVSAQVFGVWRYDCDQDDISGESRCFAVQDVLGTDGAVLLTAKLLVVQKDDIIRPRLQLTAPLGVFLPSGFLLDVSLPEPFSVPFRFCSVVGCFTNLDLAEDVVALLKKSDALTVSYRGADLEKADLSLPLSGFGDVLDEILKETVKP